MHVRDALKTWAATEGLSFADEVWDRLESLVELWARYGAAFNLVGDTGRVALLEHIREGLMAVCVAERAGFGQGAWLDVGSGAGIPGLVVGVARGSVLLVEPRERRAAFLELAVGTLKIRSATVIRARVGGKTWQKMPSAEQWEGPGVDISVSSAKAVMPVDLWVKTAGLVAPRALRVCHIRPGLVEQMVPRVLARVDFGTRSVVGVAPESPASKIRP
ncbi:MAG: RsmG family class I SAM-dependent methyltransferase [Myxococcota bacterium]